MSNGVGGYKQHLWSLFQMYSYVPSVLDSSGTPTRRLSEGGCRAIIDTLARVDVMNRFFPMESEITQREGARRMGSESFKDEVWGEMVRACARLLEFSSANLAAVAAAAEEWDELPSFSYDYEVMQPSYEQETVSWAVFSSVLLLRLNSSLRFPIEEVVLAQCREVLEPPAFLLSLKNSRTSAEALRSTTQMTLASVDPCSDERWQTLAAIQLSPLMTPKELYLLQLNQAASRSQASNDEEGRLATPSLASNVDATADCHNYCQGGNDDNDDDDAVGPQIHSPVLPIPESRTSHSDADERRMSPAGISCVSLPSNNVQRPHSVLNGIGNSSVETIFSVAAAAAAATPRAPATPVSCAPENSVDGSKIMTDASLPHSSPPPRPKHSTIFSPRYGQAASARETWESYPIDVDQLRMRLVQRVHHTLSQWAPGDDSLSSPLGSRHLLASSPPAAMPAERSFSHCTPQDDAVLVNTVSEAYCAPCDPEVNRRYNERCKKHVVATTAPSLPRDEGRGDETVGIPTPVAAAEAEDPPPNPKEYGKTDDVPLSVEIDVAADAKDEVGVAQCDVQECATGRGGAVEEMGVVRLPHPSPTLYRDPAELLLLRSGACGRPVPPRSPSRRALSRVLRGDRRPVEPVVPPTRAPPTSRGNFVAAALR